MIYKSKFDLLQEVSIRGVKCLLPRLILILAEESDTVSLGSQTAVAKNSGSEKMNLLLF